MEYFPFQILKKKMFFFRYFDKLQFQLQFKFQHQIQLQFQLQFPTLIPTAIPTPTAMQIPTTTTITTVIPTTTTITTVIPTPIPIPTPNPALLRMIQKAVYLSAVRRAPQNFEQAVSPENFSWLFFGKNLKIEKPIQSFSQKCLYACQNIESTTF